MSVIDRYEKYDNNSIPVSTHCIFLSAAYRKTGNDSNKAFHNSMTYTSGPYILIP